MATNVKLKRSAVHAKVPTTSALQLGELAINTYDGYIFLKRDGLNGEEIVRFRGNCATDESVILDTFTGDNSTVNFNLTEAPADEQYVFVTINGVSQHADAYTLSNGTLTFSQAPALNDAIECRTLAIHNAEFRLRDYQTYVYQPSSATTTFSGADVNSNTLAYDLGKIEVYLNGARLVNNLDYTATNGTSVVLQTSISSGDTLEVISLAKANFIDSEGLVPSELAATTTTAGQVVDTFKSNAYRTAKYIVSMSHATLGYHATEVLLVHDGTTVYMTEYGTIYTSSSLGTLDASILTGNVRLTVTPTNTNTTIKAKRITVSA